MVKDWTAIAKASGLPAADISRLVPPLDALEEVFRPLAQSLMPDVEPAFINAEESE